MPNPTKSSVPETVANLAEALRSNYGKFAISAASKFLWMRFRHPVIVYDSLASECLGFKADNYGESERYRTYCAAWLEKYNQCEVKVTDACSALVEIKKFTRAPNIEDDDLATWTTSKWFAGRVFDHFLVNRKNLQSFTSSKTPLQPSAR